MQTNANARITALNANATAQALGIAASAEAIALNATAVAEGQAYSRLAADLGFSASDLIAYLYAAVCLVCSQMHIYLADMVCVMILTVCCVRRWISALETLTGSRLVLGLNKGGLLNL